MSDYAAFLRSVIAAPDDDLPRLVFADWLDERGDPRGEFVRLQCRIAELTDACSREDCQCPRCLEISTLRRRERELVGEHHPKWFADLPGFWWCGNCLESGVDYGAMYRLRATFARGFVSAVTLPWGDWVRHAKELLDACPLRRVNRPRACGECEGKSGRCVPSWTEMRMDPWQECPACRGTGKVDHWAGDGRVVLTSLPETVGFSYPGGVRHATVDGVAVAVPVPDAEYDARWTDRVLVKYVIDRLWPGVDIKLPPTASNHGPSDLREPMRRAMVIDAAYRAILADTPEARP